jgi:hypothetical protein
VNAEEILFENVEALSRSFRGRMTRAVIGEVSMMAVGEIGRGESDNLG